MTVTFPLPRRTRRADFPHPALAKVSPQKRSQADQSQASELVVSAFIIRQGPTTLISPLKVLSCALRMSLPFAPARANNQFEVHRGLKRLERWLSGLRRTPGKRDYPL